MITEDGRKNANLHILPKGTLLIAITGLEAAGTRGSCAILGIKATTNQSCMALIPNTEKVTRDFLYNWYLKIGQEYGIKYTQGTKQQSYNIDILKKLPIKIPQSIEEQNKITELLTLMEQRIKFMEKNISNRKIIRKFYINKFYSENKDTTNFLGDFIKQLNIKNKTNEEYEVLSINNKKGFVKQKDQFGEHEVASSDKHNYKIINNGNYAYNPARINVGSIARLDEFENGIISPMYIMFNIKNQCCQVKIFNTFNHLVYLL